MPKLIPKAKIRKAIREADKDLQASMKSLLAHLLETLEEKDSLPAGFYGNNIIEIYKILLDWEKADKQVSAKTVSALESWIMGSALENDEYKNQ